MRPGLGSRRARDHAWPHASAYRDPHPDAVAHATACGDAEAHAHPHARTDTDADARPRHDAPEPVGPVGESAIRVLRELRELHDPGAWPEERVKQRVHLEHAGGDEREIA